jgi:hypothetical protein
MLDDRYHRAWYYGYFERPVFASEQTIIRPTWGSTYAAPSQLRDVVQAESPMPMASQNEIYNAM